MFLIVRFGGDAFVEYGIFHLVVLIPIPEEILTVDEQAENDADGKGITRSSGNQYGADAAGNA